MFSIRSKTPCDSFPPGPALPSALSEGEILADLKAASPSDALVRRFKDSAHIGGASEDEQEIGQFIGGYSELSGEQKPLQTELEKLRDLQQQLGAQLESAVKAESAAGD